MKKQHKNIRPTDPAALPGNDELLELFARESRPMRLDGLLRATGLPRRAKKELEESLADLARQGRLVRLRGGLWTRPESLKSLVGRYQALRNGGGFVTPLAAENGSPAVRVAGGRDIFIHPLQSNEAWHQDLVRVVLAPASSRSGQGRGGPNPEGRIVEILERPQKEIPVHLHSRTGRTLFCRPADSRLAVDFSVPLPEGTAVPEQGALLLVAPEERLASDLWRARLIGTYGREDDVDVQEELVKLNHEVPRDFPLSVLAEAAALPAAPGEADMAGREDLRHLPLVTIDGADARDFDDAVQVERKGKGWLLRVAIADVSHYVRPAPGKGHASLDAEALARGNSWYFPRSVEPMLPPALSNGLCSLKPQEDRLAVLAEIPFSPTGQPGKARFAPAVMRSAARLTYDQVKACLLDHDAEALARLRENPRGGDVLAMLEEAFRLYTVLREARRERGSLDFDLPEPEYTFDAEGRVLKIGFRRRHDAHRLIEEFMIAANEAVARHLRDTGLPFLYRVHPQPEPERLESLFETLAATALETMPTDKQSGKQADGRPDAAAIQGILAAAQGTDQEFLVSRLCLRAMPQARYQPENEGHFGLASQAYCHFTSPIRRYADLLVHRALKTSLGQAVGPLPAGQKLLRIGDQLNRRERAAVDCEREMARRLGCLALRDREGERFAGVVSGVTDFGLFVELADMPVEGMIRVEDLGDDWYELDSRSQCLLGQRSGLCWRLGQRLDVRLAEVHMGRLEIRLMPLELPRANRGARTRRNAGGRTRSAARPERRAEQTRKKQTRNKPADAAPDRKSRTRARAGQETRTGRNGQKQNGARPKRGR